MEQDKFTYASFTERFVAFIADSIIILIFVLGFAFIINNLTGLFVIINKSRQLEILYKWGSSTLIAFFYSILFLVHYDGATLGKKLMGIKIIKENGLSMTYSTASIRFLSNLIFDVIPIINLANYLSFFLAKKSKPGMIKLLIHL